MFIHCLQHFFLVVVQLKRHQTLVHMDHFHIVFGKVYWIENTFSYFIQMPLRQSYGNVLPFQQRVAVERAVRNYGLWD